MKLTIEPTAEMEKFDGTLCRIWKGETDAGVPVVVLIPCIEPQTHDQSILEAFNRELKQLPHIERLLVSFDLRFVS